MTIIRSIIAIAVMSALALTLALSATTTALAQEPPPRLNPAPNRGPDEGRGPFKILVIRSAMLIDGTGAPPQGPVDIVIENNRIKTIRSAGTPGLPLKPNREPQNADHEIDGAGMYVLPGFIDIHVHAGGAPKNPNMDFYASSRSNHGSYFYYWTLWDEVAWRNFYQVWFRLLNDYKKMGGRVTASADAAFIYNTYGFGNIHEMELLQEAGFHPLEVIQAATMNPAMTLHEPKGKPIEFGVVRPGLLADLVIVDQNPLENLKVLYGTGALKLNDKTGKTEWVGGVKWTIKDGIVYDARKLLADVARMVEKQKQERLKAAANGQGDQKE
jgi:hypothetical protein